MPTDRLPVLILYSRPGCHLCAQAKRALQPVLRRLGLRLEERNVQERADWQRRYGELVPVGILDGRKLFKYRVDAGAVEARIRRRLEHRRAGRSAGSSPAIVVD